MKKYFYYEVTATSEDKKRSIKKEVSGRSAKEAREEFHNIYGNDWQIKNIYRI